MSSPVSPGLIILHGNQLEQLRTAVFEWLQNNPLEPLEPEIFLVQSNGVAEWLKIAIANEAGVCAATTVNLPGRFLWSMYREMLGRDRVPARSPLEKRPLTWRLMRMLPELLEEPDFAPLRHFLADGNPERRLQLAERVADLMDQYQVYRADWLQDWTQGLDQLLDPQGGARPLAADQRWQAQLWRAILTSMPAEHRESGRSNIHQQFLQAIESGASPAGRLPGRVVPGTAAPLKPTAAAALELTATGHLPRRVVLFGMSALPYQTLQALAALSTRTQVLLAVPNPCQYYWGDIIDGRELLKAAHKRQQLRLGKDLSEVPLESLHVHSNPLLASWGRQGRDFVRMLDDFDNAEAVRTRFTNLRIDLFSEGDGDTLLEQVQSAIRDLRPIDERPAVAPDPNDRSIEFHISHSVQREVEVLHDRLLSLFADPVKPGDEPLRPRDIVVMVPDIERFSPAIYAVFGQYARADPRYIPFEIGDVKDRSINPILVALDWLMRLPQQRCRQSEVRDLLDVPALARRFGLEPDDLPILNQWIEGSGVRWGLDREHRQGLGLGRAGEQNTWLFGMQRMLLGYASGAGASVQGVESYAEVGGLNAALAGSLAQFLQTLLQWRSRLAQTATPIVWGQWARELLIAFFKPDDDRDKLTLAQLDESLQQWLEACQDGDFEEPISLEVLREAWLGPIDEGTLNHQFVSGGVTFCTLMPMRAIPFRIVCLLGLNDGDYPRRAQHVDFDLLAQPGMARPGDRSRRDDDRYLMLEALLSARQKLYISWAGRNVRDNSEQPASVLVSQLRDYLASGWDCDLRMLTTEHPLQPFSRRYFEEGGLQTYAEEWRAAHASTATAAEAPLPTYEPEADFRLNLAELTRFIKQPARYFFRQRLGVVFDDEDMAGEDEEPFGLDGLQQYQLADRLLEELDTADSGADIGVRLQQAVQRLGREGVLPIGGAGAQWQQRLLNELLPICHAWLGLTRRYPMAADKLPVTIEHPDVILDDWLDKMRCNRNETVWLEQTSSKVTSKGQVRGEKLIAGWLRQLCAAALGHSVTGFLVARDVVVQMAPLDQALAKSTLTTLIDCWREGLNRPLPVACKTALAQVSGADPRSVYDGSFQMPGEIEDACLGRLWPNFAALSADPEWPAWAETLYGPLAIWLQTNIVIAGIEALNEQAHEQEKEYTA